MVMAPLQSPHAIKRCPRCGRVYAVSEQYCGRDGDSLVEEAAADPHIGAIIDGRFKIQRSIGVGGMGSVYAAEQYFTGQSLPFRWVALKLMHPQLAASSSAVERFVKEAKAVSALIGGHTVRLFEFGQTEDGILFMAMELLEGETLQARLASRGRLCAAETVRIARDVASSLSEAHRARTIHRDLKPANVFLTLDGEQREIAKVLDFGIAKVLGGNVADQLTRTGTICGTPHYMAPETVVAGDQDARVDVYAVGVMMYEMLCGVPPFDGETPVEVMTRHQRDEPPLLHEQDPEVQAPFPLVELVWRCLAKHRDQRPADGRALCDALDALPPDALAEPPQSDAYKRLETSDKYTYDAGAMQTALVPQASRRGPDGASAYDAGAMQTALVRPQGLGADEADVGRLGTDTDTDRAATRSRRGLGIALAGVVALAVGVALWWPMSTPDAANTAATVAAPVEAVEPDVVEPEADPASDAMAARSEAPAEVPAAEPPPPAPEPKEAPTIAVTVLSRPGGASVVWQGENLGTAPQQFRVPQGTDSVTVSCSKSRYRTDRVTFRPDQDHVLTCRLPKIRPSAVLPP